MSALYTVTFHMKFFKKPPYLFVYDGKKYPFLPFQTDLIIYSYLRIYCAFCLFVL
jgi:hypothetical protein